jgi:hypothetical protein
MWKTETKTDQKGWPELTKTGDNEWRKKWQGEQCHIHVQEITEDVPSLQCEDATKKVVHSTEHSCELKVGEQSC